MVVSPDLADVLSVIIRRIRGDAGTVPLVLAYDRRECLWIGPAPLLFQRRFGADNRRICDSTIRNMLNAALASTGLTDHTDGTPLHYSPHDFRRIFITDAIMSGLPPHIAQIIAGHQDLTVTMGYKAVYPDEAIQVSRRHEHQVVVQQRMPERDLLDLAVCRRAGQAWHELEWVTPFPAGDRPRHGILSLPLDHPHIKHKNLNTTMGSGLLT